MVRKLNEEVKRLENKNAEQKVTGGKMAALEKQVKDLKQKYEESENSRKKLAYELECLTKRLKICDAEIDHLNKQEATVGQGATSTKTLSISDIESLREMEVLLA
jgi:septal ring factor EnvC (AmiA/AmiB activator)